jgi:hypothetical protein
VLEHRVEGVSDFAALNRALHLARGLEFRLVAVMVGDDDGIPFQSPDRVRGGGGGSQSRVGHRATVVIRGVCAGAGFPLGVRGGAGVGVWRRKRYPRDW